jgi:glucitol operon activator protein
MDTTKFAIVLIAALMLNAVLSYLQVRVYDKVTRRLANDYAGNADFVLVSGRAKGLFRGAVVILVIDVASKRVLAAEAMEGISVMAKFRVRPDLLGPVVTLTERTKGKRLTKAAEGALEQLAIVKANLARAAKAAKTTPAPQDSLD